MYKVYIYWLYIFYKVIYIYNIYNMCAVLYQIYKHEPKASGCIPDTTLTRMLYIAYDTIYMYKAWLHSFVLSFVRPYMLMLMPLVWTRLKLSNPYFGQLVVYKPQTTPSVYKQLTDLDQVGSLWCTEVDIQIIYLPTLYKPRKNNRTFTLFNYSDLNIC